MAGAGGTRLGLLVRTGPYLSREARSEVDLALAALTLDCMIEVYFFGDSVLQLAKDKDANEAGLPTGYKAWSALPELGEVRFHAESAWLGRCERRGIELSMPVEGLEHAGIKNRWRGCDYVVVL